MNSLIKYLYLGAKTIQYSKDDGIMETVEGVGKGCGLWMVSSFFCFSLSYYLLDHYGYELGIAFLISVGVGVFAPMAIGFVVLIVSLIFEIFKHVICKIFRNDE